MKNERSWPNKERGDKDLKQRQPHFKYPLELQRIGARGVSEARVCTDLKIVDPGPPSGPSDFSISSHVLRP